MLNSSCLGNDTTGYSERFVQLSQVAKSSEGRSVAASVTSLYNNSDAAITPRNRKTKTSC